MLNTLKKDIDILLKWFHDNYFKVNDDKCHLLVTNHDQDISLMIGKELIKGSKSVKLLVISIDNKLNCSDHVTKVCDKFSQQLHILARVATYMNTDKLRILMKAFIESQFKYCPLVWMFHSRTRSKLQTHLKSLKPKLNIGNLSNASARYVVFLLEILGLFKF